MKLYFSLRTKYDLKNYNLIQILQIKFSYHAKYYADYYSKEFFGISCVEIFRSEVAIFGHTRLLKIIKKFLMES